MELRDRQEAFIKLGYFLSQFSSTTVKKNNLIDCNSYYDLLVEKIDIAVHYNGWFTKDNILYALETWALVLTENSILKWTQSYSFLKNNTKTVGIITAGNIPLVGFHDFISVLMSGHKVVIKQSSNDQNLLPILSDYLICVEPRFKDLITFTEGQLNDFDAVIATGSNNTARYFEHYFAKYPHIIRKNRNAVAVLSGDETEAELEALGEDVFRYFGLGCRSVSKIFVPKNYDFDKLFKAVFKQNEIINYNKYKNNYDYNKTVYLMSQIPLLENGFLVLKEDTAYASPIATLFYEYYESVSDLKEKLLFDKDQIQCVVSKGVTTESIPFGHTQQPQLWEYADGVDTIDFLLNLK